MLCMSESVPALGAAVCAHMAGNATVTRTKARATARSDILSAASMGRLGNAHRIIRIEIQGSPTRRTLDEGRIGFMGWEGKGGEK
jgi:hypothetical protein